MFSGSGGSGSCVGDAGVGVASPEVFPEVFDVGEVIVVVGMVGCCG